LWSRQSSFLSLYPAILKNPVSPLPKRFVIVIIVIIGRVWKQFQALSNINSKALHTTTSPSTQKQNFEMKPERSDPKYTLISCLSITNYVLDKVKTALLKI
jgi:hypothetical protein